MLLSPKLVRARRHCRELAAHPEIVRGQVVLEIGSGCGACGILAAKLGASQVQEGGDWRRREAGGRQGLRAGPLRLCSQLVLAPSEGA